MGTTTVDLPVTYARIVYGGSTPDDFITTLGDEDETDEVVLTVADTAHIYVIKWNNGADQTVELPDPPAGSTLVDARYVAKAYRDIEASGGDSSGFGYHPNPLDAPYMVSSAIHDSPVIDGFPVGAYDGVVVSRASEDLSLLATGTTGNFNGDGWFAADIAGGDTSGSIHVCYLALRLFYDDGTIDLPCDTDVALDLSSAVFLDNSGTLSGQYVDGVITSTGDFLQPDFYIPGLVVDPLGVYKITFTYDPDSSHDGGAREAYVSGLRPGHEQDDVDTAYAAGDEYSDIAVWWDTWTSETGDTLTFVVGPGRGPGPVGDHVSGVVSWDDGTFGVAAGYTAPWFESAAGAALSAITIRKLCTFAVPPLRLINRGGDQFSSAWAAVGHQRTRQGGNRQLGIL